MKVPQIYFCDLDIEGAVPNIALQKDFKTRFIVYPDVNYEATNALNNI